LDPAGFLRGWLFVGVFLRDGWDSTRQDKDQEQRRDLCIWSHKPGLASVSGPDGCASVAGFGRDRTARWFRIGVLGREAYAHGREQTRI
jgi:hypothetical protein